MRLWARNHSARCSLVISDAKGKTSRVMALNQVCFETADASDVIFSGQQIFRENSGHCKV